MPLRLIRFVTDPIVDSVIYLVSRMVLPPIYRTISWSWATLAYGIGTILGRILPKNAMESLGILVRLFNIYLLASIDILNRKSKWKEAPSSRSE